VSQVLAHGAYVVRRHGARGAPSDAAAAEQWSVESAPVRSLGLRPDGRLMPARTVRKRGLERPPGYSLALPLPRRALDDLLHQHSLRQGDVARGLQVDPANVSAWCQAKRPLPSYWLTPLARLLGVSVADVMRACRRTGRRTDPGPNQLLTCVRIPAPFLCQLKQAVPWRFPDGGDASRPDGGGVCGGR
jgi:hypothetical protein